MALNRVQVVVVGALDLPAMDGKTADPYVKFQYRGKDYRTPTLKKTLQPKWDYTAEIRYNKVFGPHLLYLEVWDANVIRSDKLIGKATLNLESMEENVFNRKKSRFDRLMSRTGGSATRMLQSYPTSREASFNSLCGWLNCVDLFQLNKVLDKWYPLEHVAKAQDSAALRVKLTLLPPLSEASPNAGAGQKVVVVPHRSAQATAFGPSACSVSTILSPPPAYPLYAASPPTAAYRPPVAPPNYCYPAAAPPPLVHPPPLAYPHPVAPLPPVHPPPSGYPPPAMAPTATSPSLYETGATYAYPVLPPYAQPGVNAFQCPPEVEKHREKATKKKVKEESPSAESDSSSRSESSDATSKAKGKNSRAKPQVVKMEITLPSL